MREYVDRIVAMKPEVVGFSLYYTNEIPTTWMAREIRKQLPNTKLIVGGPQAGSMMQGTAKCFDHVVVGEGEELDAVGGGVTGDAARRGVGAEVAEVRRVVELGRAALPAQPSRPGDRGRQPAQGLGAGRFGRSILNW